MKTLFISFDGMDGSGKGWAVQKLADRLRADGLKVWAGPPRAEVGSCYEQAKDPAGVPAYVERVISLRGRLAAEHDVVIWDRSPVTLIGWWGFGTDLVPVEELFEMLRDTFADISILLQPPLEVCRVRALRSDRPESKMAKTEAYFQAFADSTTRTVEFLKPRLGNRFVAFEDNEAAVEWAYQMVKRLDTHFDLHLTNACPLKCPTCCFGAGEGTKTEQAIDGRLRDIVDAGFAAGIREFHLMGGEPLTLGARLVELMRYIRERGGKTHLLTSGYTLRHADEVLPLADAVFVSLDGPRDTHNRTRGLPIFDNTCEFISRAASHGCKIRIGTVVSRQNISTAHQVVDVLAELGVSPRSLCWMNMSPTGGLFSQTHGDRAVSSAALDNYLAPEEWLGFVARLKNDESIRSLPWAKVEPAFSNRPENLGCELLQGKRRVMVMSDGSMYLCPMLTPLPSDSNILEGDPVAALVRLLSWSPDGSDPCEDGCQGGCLGYAKLFGNGTCDARCGNPCVASRLPERFRLSEALVRQGYRPMCPCRTVQVKDL